MATTLPDLPKITLVQWAQRCFATVPHRNTLRRWAREGLINPAPQKVGRDYLVHPQATYVGKVAEPVGTGT